MGALELVTNRFVEQVGTNSLVVQEGYRSRWNSSCFVSAMVSNKLGRWIGGDRSLGLLLRSNRMI